MMTLEQRKLARHALGFPNSRNESYRNHFCVGVGDDGFQEWEDLVAKGLAIKRTGPTWGGDDMFHLTLEGALWVRDPKEHLSVEKVAFESPEDRGFKVKASYLIEPKGDASDALIEVFKDGELLRWFLFPAYKIWNIAAHFSDIVDSELAGDKVGYDMAAWTGFSVLPTV